MDIPQPQDSSVQTNHALAPGEQATTLAADRVLDITGETCPMTFVRTRLALDALGAGQRLLVRLRGAEPRRQVPESARALGHRVLAEQEQADGSLLLLLLRT